VVRYLSQARELERLGGESKTIKVEICESSQTGDLLRVLGLPHARRMRHDVVLENGESSARSSPSIPDSAGGAGVGAAHQSSVHGGLSSHQIPIRIRRTTG